MIGGVSGTSDWARTAFQYGSGKSWASAQASRSSVLHSARPHPVPSCTAQHAATEAPPPAAVDAVKADRLGVVAATVMRPGSPRWS